MIIEYMRGKKELSLSAQEKEILTLWKKTKTAGQPAVLAFFKQRLAYLQNERLIHLFVTLFFSAASLFLSPFALQSENQYFILISLLILIPTAFYVCYYFNLENTCQRWQRLALEFEEELLSSKNK